ncbi:MAG: 3-phosphoshikimate 1-carboxyvinyltransferase [Woeseiaceae bacterium]
MSTEILESLPVTDGLHGELAVPGDKSVSHRSLMLLAIADGTGEVTGLLEGEDCIATANAMQMMGAEINRIAPGRYVVNGSGLRGLRRPDADIDLGNSGTGMRLLCGLLSAQAFPTRLVGDESLSVRPMRRVTKPLTAMGAVIHSNDGCAPLTIRPSNGLNGIRYDMPIASAQLKSALILAGLYANGETELIEPGPSRDHTERMLSAMGANIESERQRIVVQPTEQLRAIDIQVPADLSSAAFFLVAASIVPDSCLTLTGVGVNPTRTGVLDILASLGANIEVSNKRVCGGEPVADLLVRSANLKAIDLDPALVPLAIDEFPILFIAAAAADGVSRFSGLEELRHKESDRIGVMTKGLRELGIVVEEGEDWVEITGGPITGGTIDSHGDHRIAMAFAVAAACSSGSIFVEKPENIATSFPNFVYLANQVGLKMMLGMGNS